MDPHADARRLLVAGTLFATISLASLGASIDARAAKGDAETSEASQHYVAAYARWRARPTPRYLVYDVAIDGTHGRDVFHDRFHVRYRAVDRKSLVSTLAKTGTQPPFEDVAHQPVFADDTFGFVDRVRSGALATNVAAPTAAMLPYTAALADRTTIGGRSVLHLRLTPKVGGAQYPVRDVWIDPATEDVVRLHALGTHRAGPVSAHVDIVLEYADAPGGYRLVRSEQADATARIVFAPYRQLGHGTFSKIKTPQALPALDAAAHPSANGPPLAPDPR